MTEGVMRSDRRASIERVLMVISAYVNTGRWRQCDHCWASSATLGKESRVSVRTVQYAIRWLREQGYVRTEMSKSPVGMKRKIWVLKDRTVWKSED